MIKEAKKPYIFVGGGAVLIRSQRRTYMTFAEKVDAPVTDSLMGKGAFPGTDPRIYRNAWNAWNKNLQLRCQRV